MAVTYYVALPFIRTEDGVAPAEAQECQSEGNILNGAVAHALAALISKEGGSIWKQF